MAGSRPDLLTMRRLGWASVLAVNLPIPAYLGYLCTPLRGRVGMVAGIGLIWLLGHECCRRQPRLASVVIPGGCFVALSQFVPILQFWSGAFALRLANLGIEQPGAPRVEGDLAAFTAALLTGGMLLAVAAGCGLLYCLVVPDKGHVRALGKPKVDRDELS